MVVRLVSYNAPSKEFLDEGLENVQDLIAFCARVSNPSAQINSETSEKLIKYLIKHQHWSPLEMVSALIVVADKSLIVPEVALRVFTVIPELERTLLPTLNELDTVIDPVLLIITPVPPIVGSAPRRMLVSTTKDGT